MTAEHQIGSSVQHQPTQHLNRCLSTESCGFDLSLRTASLYESPLARLLTLNQNERGVVGGRCSQEVLWNEVACDLLQRHGHRQPQHWQARSVAVGAFTQPPPNLTAWRPLLTWWPQVCLPCFGFVEPSAGSQRCGVGCET